MNFQTKDTKVVVGVSASIASFVLGMFVAFFLSGSNIFIINILLGLASTSLVGIGIILLVCAVEVMAKTEGPVTTPIGKAIAKVYDVMIGENVDSMKAHEVEEAVALAKTPVTASSRDNPNTVILHAVETSDLFDQTAEAVDTHEEILVGNAKGKVELKENHLSHASASIIAKSYAIEDSIQNSKKSELSKTTDNPFVEVTPLVPIVDTKDSVDTIEELPVWDVVATEEVDVAPAVDPVVTTPVIITIPYPKLPPTIHQKGVEECATMVDEENSNTQLDDSRLKKIILIGDKGIHADSDDFGLLLGEALALSEIDSSFKLRLKGKTHGLGARGVKTVRKNTEFVSFGKQDIQKMIKKFDDSSMNH